MHQQELNSQSLNSHIVFCATVISQDYRMDMIYMIMNSELHQQTPAI